MKSLAHSPPFVAAVAALVASASAARGEQVWFTQGVSVPAAERLRLNFSNTCYTEHGEHRTFRKPDLLKRIAHTINLP